MPPIKNRRRAREAALQTLFQIDVGYANVDDALDFLQEHIELPPEAVPFVRRIVDGVDAHIEAIDAVIESKLRDWTLGRLAPVDRNVLRMAVYELYHCPEIPPAVTLNEAVNLAKKFGTEESGRFVNGALGSILLESPKANWDRAAAPPEAIEEALPPDEPLVEEVDVPEGESVDERAERIIGWKLKTEHNE